ncbi:hypothetical protein LTR78_007701 [Recurvomyces mirabilis]|uniref:Amidase domain-containing protein n=1 Tax=Recurvomyces mirabilis TaxID=574656 RepID=A0AAE0WJ54_9PEZI|nr:hypothetical protein LTR78_007701 [Recurvomyces mirabilis]KAK5151588.1 hypothetical protein LTS14_009075 [Recurvomyces mirabilis]
MAAGNEPPVQSVKNVNLASIPAVSMPGLILLNGKRAGIQQAYRKLWVDNNLDAIITPGAPTTATPLDKWDSITYTMLWNFMDYPTCIIPVDCVQSGDVVDSVSHAINGERDEHNYLMYTGPEAYANAALSVQVVGMRQEDERLAQIVCQVDKILNVKHTKEHALPML